MSGFHLKCPIIILHTMASNTPDQFYANWSMDPQILKKFFCLVKHPKHLDHFGMKVWYGNYLVKCPLPSFISPNLIAVVVIIRVLLMNFNLAFSLSLVLFFHPAKEYLCCYFTSQGGCSQQVEQCWPPLVGRGHLLRFDILNIHRIQIQPQLIYSTLCGVVGHTFR